MTPTWSSQLSNSWAGEAFDFTIYISGFRWFEISVRPRAGPGPGPLRVKAQAHYLLLCLVVAVSGILLYASRTPLLVRWITVPEDPRFSLPSKSTPSMDLIPISTHGHENVAEPSTWTGVKILEPVQWKQCMLGWRLWPEIGDEPRAHEITRKRSDGLRYLFVNGVRVSFRWGRNLLTLRASDGEREELCLFCIDPEMDSIKDSLFSGFPVPIHPLCFDIMTHS